MADKKARELFLLHLTAEDDSGLLGVHWVIPDAKMRKIKGAAFFALAVTICNRSYILRLRTNGRPTEMTPWANFVS